MDKIYLHKLLKTVIATPLALGIVLALDIAPELSFFGPLFVFVTIWLFPDPIPLKALILRKLMIVLLPILFLGAFVRSLWQFNSIVLFFFILLIGFGIQVWLPSAIKLGFLPMGCFLVTSVLNSSAPYTTAVDMLILLGIGLGLGWLAERFFWPVFHQPLIGQQMSATFMILKNLNNLAFYATNKDQNAQKTLNTKAQKSLRMSKKSLQTATMTGSMSPSELNIWSQGINLQERLLAHLLAISDLLQENQENPLLEQLKPELSNLGESLSTILTEFSMAITIKHPNIQISSPNHQFQKWQTRLEGMRRDKVTVSYGLSNRLVIGLIEHRLEGLLSDTSKIVSWFNQYYSIVPRDFPSELKPAQL